MKFKSVVGAVTAAALITSSAFAADAPAKAPLPAGKAAGTKEAALLGPLLIPALVAAGIGIFVGIAASGGFNDSKATASTNGFQGSHN